MIGTESYVKTRDITNYDLVIRILIEQRKKGATETWSSPAQADGKCSSIGARKVFFFLFLFHFGLGGALRRNSVVK